MWCKCKILNGVDVGCLNIPYSNTPLGGFSIRVKMDGDYLDFNSPSIEDVFILIKTIDDNKANVYEKLSISNSGIIVDENDSTKIKLSVTKKMLNKKNNTLYYQFFIQENDEYYYLMKGEFVYQQNYN